jgi:hypothetical protein
MQQNEIQPNPQTSSSVPVPAACRHIRCKETYYESPGTPEDEFHSGIYWCVRTQENRGPDGLSCGKCECGPDRACYQS